VGLGHAAVLSPRCWQCQPYKASGSHTGIGDCPLTYRRIDLALMPIAAAAPTWDRP
jgi:hypothetical protein